MRLKTKQVLKLLKRFDQSLSVKMKWSTNCGLWYDTQSCWKVANNVTDLLIRKNYLQKIQMTRKQVKKMMVKQATMGMWAQDLAKKASLYETRVIFFSE